jgi:hypothetical protein
MRQLIGIAITIISIALILNAKVCTGDYEGDINAVCSDKIGTIIINKLNQFLYVR